MDTRSFQHVHRFSSLVMDLSDPMDHVPNISLFFPINLATVWESVTWTQLRESGKIHPPIPRIPLYPLFWLTWLVWIWIVIQHQCAGFQMFPSFRFYELGSRDFEGFDV